MRIIALIIFFPILGVAQDGYPIQEAIDVIKYANSIELSDSSDQIIGKTVVEFKLKSDVAQIRLDLVKKNGEHGMIVQGVFCRDEPLNHGFYNNQVVIDLTQKIRDNKAGVISVLYEGIPADGLIIDENKHGDRTFFGDNWPNRAHHWFPCIDHPADKALIDFEVVAPSTYQVVSNGTLAQRQVMKNGYTKTNYSSAHALPTKVMVIGVAKFAISQCQTTSKVEQSAYVYPQEREDGFADYCSATKILNWFEGKISPYPYEKLAHVQSKTRYGGMENAGCIFYHENSIDGKQGSEYLFAHEIAHQWFGNSATEKDWHHVWLSEGFATYLTEVYKLETAGDTAFFDGMEAARQLIIRFQKKFPNAAVIDTSIVDLNSLLNPLTYQKAAWILHMLKAVVGEDVFWKGIRSYYEEFQYRNALSIDFQREMEKVSGKDLSKFFDTWLYQPGLVQLEVTLKYNEKIKELTVFCNQPKDGWFVIPLKFPWFPNRVEVMNDYKSKYVFSGVEKPPTDKIIDRRAFLTW